jgi:hypothetical protein
MEKMGQIIWGTMYVYVYDCRETPCPLPPRSKNSLWGVGGGHGMPPEGGGEGHGCRLGSSDSNNPELQ